MAPIPRHSKKGSRVAAIIGQRKALYRSWRRANRQITEFAEDLKENLRSPNIPTSLSAELYRHLDRIPLIHNADAASRCRDLDEQGTKLWNLASSLKRDGSINTELGCLGAPSYKRSLRRALTGVVRVFACLLLDQAQRCTLRSTSSENIGGYIGHPPGIYNEPR